MSKPNLTRRSLIVAMAGVALSASMGASAQSYTMKYMVSGLTPSGAPDTPAPDVPYDFTSYTFTNCGQTGRAGPTLDQCLEAYADAEWATDRNTFSVNNGIQIWTVPENGTYRIAVSGAQGGGTEYRPGGKGALIEGDFHLEKGTKLKILVGQTGGVSGYDRRGGGGGSFVFLGSGSSLADLLVAAGGGGGGGSASDENPGPGVAGNDGTSGFGTYNGVGGKDGNGGGHTGGANGGAGYLSNGTAASAVNVAFRPLEEGLGGAGYAPGGFGGGGSAVSGNNAAAGGGGFSGGGGSRRAGNMRHRARAGGGGSYNVGANQVNQSGMNIGHGKVVITLLK